MLKRKIYEQYPHVTEVLERRVYKRRRSSNISQYALAEKIGVSRNCIQQIECHEHLPKQETLFAIIQALGFSEEEYRDFLLEYMNAHFLDMTLQQEDEVV